MTLYHQGRRPAQQRSSRLRGSSTFSSPQGPRTTRPAVPRLRRAQRDTRPDRARRRAVERGGPVLRRACSARSPTRCSARTWQGPPPIGPATNYSMPWFVSNRGYGFLLDSTWLNRFDLTGDGHLAGHHRRAGGAATRSTPVRRRPTCCERATADPTIGRQPPPAEWFFGPWYQPTGSDDFRRSSRRGAGTPVAEGGLDVPVTVAQTTPTTCRARPRPSGRATGAQAANAQRVPRLGLPGHHLRQLVRLLRTTPTAPTARPTPTAGSSRPRWAPPIRCRTSAYLDDLVRRRRLHRARRRRVLAGAPPGGARDDGYDGWMEDFGEFVPPDARLADGRSGLAAHNVLLHRLPRRVARADVAAEGPRLRPVRAVRLHRHRPRWPASCGAATRPRTTPRPTGWPPP